MISIKLHEGTELEEKGQEQLERILENYDLEKWIFTKDVLIQSFVTPHSHPVLTLNTRYTDGDDEGQLATFLHEQIHWYADADSISTEKAINTFREMYPEVPIGDGQGARSEYSTYLHLLVCWLEYDALRQLLGEEEARTLLEKKTYYRWIYNKVLTEGKQLRDVVTRYGLEIE